MCEFTKVARPLGTCANTRTILCLIAQGLCLVYTGITLGIMIHAWRLTTKETDAIKSISNDPAVVRISRETSFDQEDSFWGQIKYECYRRLGYSPIIEVYVDVRHAQTLEPLQRLRSLEIVRLHGSPQLRFDLASIPSLPALSMLTLEEFVVRDFRPLLRQKNLRELKVLTCESIDINTLREVSQLRQVVYNKTLLSRKEEESLRAALPDCRIVATTPPVDF